MTGTAAEPRGSARVPASAIHPAPSAALPWPARLLLAVGPVALAAALGSAATLPNIPNWYAGLTKPPFTPPNAVFGPAWSVLYGLMAWAAWRILSRPPSAARTRALALFGVQLALNAGWSCLFFAAHRPGLALAEIVVLLGAIGGTIAAFRTLDRVAALALVPYVAWVGFALYLNAGIWRLNG